eukprot:1602856-Prymnesium_polylepis.1
MYTPAQKRKVVEQTAGMQPAAAIKYLKTVAGYEKVNKKMLKCWRRNDGKAKRKSGVKPYVEFEKAVLDDLIYSEVELIDGKETAVVKANVVYSHAMIETAAKKIQATDEFKFDPKVAAMKFSRPWIRGWLRRNALRKHRVTATEKVLPEPAVVQARMAEIQLTKEHFSFTDAETLSTDETG